MGIAVGIPAPRSGPQRPPRLRPHCPPQAPPTAPADRLVKTTCNAVHLTPQAALQAAYPAPLQDLQRLREFHHGVDEHLLRLAGARRTIVAATICAL